MTKISAFNKHQSKEGNIVDLSTLRQVARARFAKAEKAMDPKADLKNAPKSSSHDSLLGMLVMNMLLAHMGAPIADFGLHTHLPSDETFGLQEGTLSTVFDFYTNVRDQAAVVRRNRRLNDYPEGRRVDPMMVHSLNKNFNMVSTNDNGYFSQDASAEKTAMADILDIIEELEKEGVMTLKIDAGQSAYSVLKGLKREAELPGQVIKFNTPMRKLA